MSRSGSSNRGPVSEAALSFARLPWAMTMWGAQQAARLMMPQAGAPRAAQAAESLRHAAYEHMGETARGLYRAGEHLQEGLVDTVKSLAGGTAPSTVKENKAWDAIVHPWSAGVGKARTADDETGDEADEEP